MPQLIVTLLLLTALFSSGCATTNGPTTPSDPLESYNRAIHGFNQSFDKAIATPVAKAYQKITPSWLDRAITNFFSNLDDVIILSNDLLQFKFLQAAQDATRIVFNTTFGLLGFFDPATTMNLRKHNEDFGQTLGYWGVPSGPYFVLPFLGPSTIRDSAGLAVDYTYVDPVIHYHGDPAVRYSFLALNYIDKRADYLGATDLVKTAALDEYVFIREAYLQRRQYHVYDGDPPTEEGFNDAEEQGNTKGETQQ